MKKFISIMTIVAGSLVFMSFSVQHNDGVQKKETKAKFVMPKGVHAVVMKHCYMCHNTKSRGDKSKKKLNYDLLTHMALPDLVGKLQDMHDVLSKDKMPPEKFLEHHPEKALNAQEKSLLINWTKTTMDNLMKSK